jgi:hypothetical protein
LLWSEKGVTALSGDCHFCFGAKKALLRCRVIAIFAFERKRRYCAVG